MANKTKSKIDYEQVNCDSGDEEQPEDRHQQEQLKRPKPHSLSSSFRTASTSIETNECTEPLNCETAAIDNIIEMGTNAAPPMYDERKMASNFDKFRLLMWKNFLIQYRHPIQTILEIMVPVLLSVILILIRSIIDPDIYSHNTVYKPFHINTLYPLRADSRSTDAHISGQFHLRVIRIKEFVQRSFPGANLKEEYQVLLTYYVPPSNTLKWSSMFGLMETAKRTLHIEDYSISQTSLEQVFLSFTKFQREEIITNRSANR